MPSKHQACSQSSCDSWLDCKWLWLQSVNSRVLHVCASDMFARCIMEVEAMMSVVSCPFYQVHVHFANLPNQLCQVVKVTLLSCEVHFAKCVSSSHQVHIQFVTWMCLKLLKACKRIKRMQKCHNNIHCFLFLKGIKQSWSLSCKKTQCPREGHTRKKFQALNNLWQT